MGWTSGAPNYVKVPCRRCGSICEQPVRDAERPPQEGRHYSGDQCIEALGARIEKLERARSSERREK